MTQYDHSHLTAHAALREAGYTEFLEYSECGDNGYRSREYWARPGTTLNQYGYPYERAEISNLYPDRARGWVVHIPQYGPTSLDFRLAQAGL